MEAIAAHSLDIDSLEPLTQRVKTALEAAATACGCTMDHAWVGERYADMVDNQPMVQAYVRNAARVGRTVRDPSETGRPVVGSTDMGNISYLVPSIHPMLKVAPDGTPIHTVDFAAHAASAEGDQAVIDGAKVMAMTVVDLWTSDALLADVRAHFDQRPRDVQVY